MRYKFRAECQGDYNHLLQILPNKPNDEKILPINGFPGIEVEFDIDIPIEELRNIMYEVQNGHVMVQTLMPKNEYTGERNYEV